MFKKYFYLFILFFSGTTAIQNEPTLAKSSRDDVQLSASSFAPEKTMILNKNHDDTVRNFKTTQLPIVLESSKSIETHDDHSRLMDYEKQLDISLDERVTASKNIEHIDENNIESKYGDYE